MHICNLRFAASIEVVTCIMNLRKFRIGIQSPQQLFRCTGSDLLMLLLLDIVGEKFNRVFIAVDNKLV